MAAFIDILDLLDSTIDNKGIGIIENANILLDAYKSIRDVWDLDTIDEEPVRTVR